MQTDANISTAEKMLAELSDVVAHIHGTAPDSAGIHSALGAMTFTDNHIAFARAAGHDATQTATALQRQIGDVIQSLKAFARSMPPGDENVAAVNSLIERLT